MLAGASPFSAQFSRAVSGSKSSRALPSPQWVMPGTMKSRAKSWVPGVSCCSCRYQSRRSLAEKTGSETPSKMIILPPRALKVVRSVATASLMAAVCRVSGRTVSKFTLKVSNSAW